MIIAPKKGEIPIIKQPVNNQKVPPWFFWESLEVKKVGPWIFMRKNSVTPGVGFLGLAFLRMEAKNMCTNLMQEKWWRLECVFSDSFSLTLAGSSRIGMDSDGKSFILSSRCFNVVDCDTAEWCKCCHVMKYNLKTGGRSYAPRSLRQMEVPWITKSSCHLRH